MNKTQTKNQTHTAGSGKDAGKPRKLGRGLSALLGEPVRVDVNGGSGSGGRGGGDEASSAPGAAGAAQIEVKPAALSPRADEIVRDGEPGGDLQGGARVVMIDAGTIRPGPFQPRRQFDEAGLNELAASIRSAGVVQPVLVRPVRDGGDADGCTWELVAGERRWRASKLAGLARVPAVVSTLTDEQAAQWGLIENVQRADLSALERAYAVRALGERFGLTHQQIAERLGVDRSSVSNSIRLTELEPEIRDLLEKGELSGGHGKALLGAPAGLTRIGLARQTVSQGWSVRRLEQACARAAQAPAGAAPSVTIPETALAKAAALKDLEKQLGEHLGTRVRVRAAAGGKRGTIVLSFYDLDHFDGLMSKLGFVLS